MKLLLHTPNTNSELAALYRSAFANSVELFIVSAYLTEWDTSLKLSTECQFFRVVVGQDFGITRKRACKELIRWLPKDRKTEFLVASQIIGFHPKAAFWKDKNSKFYSLIGSSNLTRAAFEKNYEANVYAEISSMEYSKARSWLAEIERFSIPVSPNWLASYHEAEPRPSKKRAADGASDSFPLPPPTSIAKLLRDRRKQLETYKTHKTRLIELFRKCASKTISSESFFQQLPHHWSMEIGNRLQGEGFERLGKASDFQSLASSFLRILDANPDDRDSIVVREINFLHKHKIPTRGAFLSEMLCLAFPNDYPVLNKPVRDYLKAVKFRAPKGSGEGGRYLDLAKRLRTSLLAHPKYPAKSIAELDAVIWKAYNKQ